MKCFTIAPQDIQQIQALFKACPIDMMPKYSSITGASRITLKAPEMYNGALVNADANITVTKRSKTLYDIHYETVGALMRTDVEGLQRPFDCTIFAEADKFKIISCPQKDAKMFLEANFKFGLKQPHYQYFPMAYESARFMYDLFPMVFDKRESFGNEIYTFRPNYYEIASNVLKAKLWDNRREHLLDGWDVVNLTDKQYYKVADTVTENNIKYDIDNFALPRFALSLFSNGEMTYYFFEQKGRTVRCGITDTKTYNVGWFNVIIHGIDENGEVDCTMQVDDEKMNEWLNELCETKDDSDGRNWEWIASAFLTVNAFMLHFGDVTMEVETKQAVAPSEPSQKKHKYHRNSVRLYKCYKLIRGWKGKARKKAEITCLAWGVRGHFRHYRNGKVVFIDAYVKGKERDKYTGKEYNLLPYKDA